MPPVDTSLVMEKPNVVYLNDSESDLDESMVNDMDESDVESEIGSSDDDRRAEEARIAAQEIEKEKRKKSQANR